MSCTDTKLLAAYKAYEHEQRSKSFRLLLVLGIILSPLYTLLDWILYPEQFKSLVTIRWLLELILAANFFATFTSLVRYIRWFGLTTVMAMNISFIGMTYLTEGMASPYYAGVNLVLVAANIFLPWPLKDITWVSVLTLLIYISSSFLKQYTDPTVSINYAVFFNNVYFMASTCVICTVAAYSLTKQRFEEFRLHYNIDRLETLDREKSQFFANISHEFRTPLTLILGPVQDLLQQPQALTAAVKDALTLVRDNGFRLLKLVNDLLEVIRLEAGKNTLQPEVLAANTYISGLTDTMKPLAHRHQLTLVKQLTSTPALIKVDPDALEKIIVNLLSNAIKFTAAGGTVSISTHCQKEQFDIIVDDTGMGIAAKDMPHIFDRFHQVDNSSTRAHTGTGLGLALVKELTEAHGGTVHVTSEPGQGTCFTLSFPLLTEATATTVNTTFTAPDADDTDSATLSATTVLHRTAQQVGSLTTPAAISEATALLVPDDEAHDRPTVLVVEDEQDVRHYVVHLLLEEHYRILQADNGDSGLALAKEHQPPLLVLDGMLPKRDGIDVCQQLKADPTTRHIKIILLTARVDEQAKVDALQAGADDFLTKPFNRLELLARLGNLWQNTQLQQDLHQQNQALKTTLDELTHTQERLIHSEKINALGRLSAGLLHEINNPLNYSLMAIGCMQQESTVQQHATLQETVADAAEGMARIQQIISGLRTFAHPSQADQKAAFSWTAALDSALRFTAYEHRSIQVVRLVSTDYRLQGSNTQIVQLLINLLTNACKAIEQAGRQDSGGVITINSQSRGDRVAITLHDNGVGMTAATRSRVFDPFFTTRDVGEGMGLGLSICHTIIKNHGGQLTVDSQPGQGCTFTFDLALADQQPE